MMTEPLKPCPFCGNEHPEIASGDSVVCNTDGHTGCGCSAFYDRWNERTPGPATRAMLDAAVGMQSFQRIRNVTTDLTPVLEAFLAEWDRLPLAN